MSSPIDIPLGWTEWEDPLENSTCPTGHFSFLAEESQDEYARAGRCRVKCSKRREKIIRQRLIEWKAKRQADLASGDYQQTEGSFLLY